MEFNNNYDISLKDINNASLNIKDIAYRTPLKKSFILSQKLQRNIYLKLETTQPTGSFKVRGAANKLLKLSEVERTAGVITASSGNHGLAMAYLAKELGIPAVVCLTEVAPPEKVKKISKMGAEVVIYGRDQDQATARAQRLALEKGHAFIPAFDDKEIIAGQGTIGTEILKQNPSVDTLIVQVSGGGLMSGIALACKSINPDIRVIGVTCEKGAAIYESIKAGKIISVDEPRSIADALTGPIPKDNQYTFKMCKELVDEIIPVSDSLIEDAMVHALLEEKIILEGGGAAGIALLMKIEPSKLGKNVAVICSGDNVSPEKVIQLVKKNRRNCCE